MRIFTKRSFQFDHPAGQERPVTVRSQSFVDVPDWVADSAMFKLAVSDGDVMPIESKQDEIAAEMGSPDRATRAKAREAAKALKEEKAKADAEAKAAAEMTALKEEATRLLIADVDKLDKDGLIAAIAAATQQ